MTKEYKVEKCSILANKKERLFCLSNFSQIMALDNCQRQAEVQLVLKNTQRLCKEQDMTYKFLLNCQSYMFSK